MPTALSYHLAYVLKTLYFRQVLNVNKGQLPQNIALKLQETGHARVLGTDPVDIDKAENRQQFSKILDSLGVDQPAWEELTSGT